MEPLLAKFTEAEKICLIALASVCLERLTPLLGEGSKSRGLFLRIFQTIPRTGILGLRPVCENWIGGSQNLSREKLEKYGLLSHFKTTELARLNQVYGDVVLRGGDGTRGEFKGAILAQCKPHITFRPEEGYKPPYLLFSCSGLEKGYEDEALLLAIAARLSVTPKTIQALLQAARNPLEEAMRSNGLI